MPDDLEHKGGFLTTPSLLVGYSIPPMADEHNVEERSEPWEKR
jgi:hypothetical protein